MGFFRPGRSGWVLGACGLGVAWICAAPGWGAAHSRPRHVVELTPWEQAVKARDEFEAQPAGTHTKLSYTETMDGFRSIYHDNPRDRHAADAVYAVAGLLAEQGRELDDAASLKSAVGQYEFLRVQYPGSPLRRKAAEGAQGALEAVRTEPTLNAAKEHKLHGAATEIHGEASGVEALPFDVEPVAEARTSAPKSVRGAGLPQPGLPQVTGIRHWSTPTYTRVAIDLGDEVTFQAARVPNPDRIYFDLHGARLGAELVGKSFSVTDDGFLKRIRAAQASPNVTRVVLDVNDVTDYSAFLLPNPYRLIIDIHGSKSRGTTAPKNESETVSATPVAAADSVRASAAANSSGLPAMAPTDGGAGVKAGVATAASGVSSGAGSSENGRALNAAVGAQAHTSEARRGASASMPAAKLVPNTVAVKAPATTTEVAAVSDAPGKVEATLLPSSKPIAAMVPVARDVNLGTLAAPNPTTRAGRRKRSRAEVLVAGDAAPAKAAEKTADGQTSMIRALGLKIGRIVIDAGHGGHDSGTLGVDGIEEKDVVLDVALRVGRLLHDRLGAEIIYTRSDDTFIPLETRTAIANKAQADLFLSIHANSSQDETARGVETYYLNFTSDPGALDVAARENAVGGQSIHQLSDLVKKITLKDKIAESREFAADVEGSLYAGLAKGNDGLKNRGVKKAPFVVLIGANMPSILAEISFVTNPKDASQLRQPEYRERVAESLYRGVAKYEGGLAGARAPMTQASTE